MESNGWVSLLSIEQLVELERALGQSKPSPVGVTLFEEVRAEMRRRSGLGQRFDAVTPGSSSLSGGGSRR